MLWLGLSLLVLKINDQIKRVGQASLPVEPREFSSRATAVVLKPDLILALDVQIKVVRARTLAHRDRQGRLLYLARIQGILFKRMIKPNTL